MDITGDNQFNINDLIAAVSGILESNLPPECQPEASPECGLDLDQSGAVRCLEFQKRI